MTLHSESPLDATDWQILRELQKDARLSYRELGKRVSLSPPATAERVRKLEDRGIIKGYTVQVDLEKVGLPLIAFLLLRCDPVKCLTKTTTADAFPEIREIYTLSGTYCSLIKVAVASMAHLESFTARLSKHGDAERHVVIVPVITNRPIDWEDQDIDIDAPSIPGWNLET